MSDFLQELKEEGRIINENYRKGKCIFKVLVGAFISVLFTGIFCCIFSYINLKFNFYDNNSLLLTIVFSIVTLRAFIITEDITKVGRKIRIRFLLCLIMTAIILIPNFDFTKLTQMLVSVLIICGIFVSNALINYYEPKRKNILIILIMVLIYYLYKQSYIHSDSIILLEFWSFIVSYNFISIKKKIMEEGMTIVKFNSCEFYGYLFTTYVLFMLLYSNMM